MPILCTFARAFFEAPPQRRHMFLKYIHNTYYIHKIRKYIGTNTVSWLWGQLLLLGPYGGRCQPCLAAIALLRATHDLASGHTHDQHPLCTWIDTRGPEYEYFWPTGALSNSAYAPVMPVRATFTVNPLTTHPASNVMTNTSNATPLSSAAMHDSF